MDYTPFRGRSRDQSLFDIPIPCNPAQLGLSTSLHGVPAPEDTPRTFATYSCLRMMREMIIWVGSLRNHVVMNTIDVRWWWMRGPSPFWWSKQIILVARSGEVRGGRANRPRKLGMDFGAKQCSARRHQNGGKKRCQRQRKANLQRDYEYGTRMSVFVWRGIEKVSKFKSAFKRYTESGIVQKCYLLIWLSGGAAAEMAKTRTPRKGSDAGSGGLKRSHKSGFFCAKCSFTIVRRRFVVRKYKSWPTVILLSKAKLAPILDGGLRTWRSIEINSGSGRRHGGGRRARNR